MSMDQRLAEFYGTNKSNEELEKAAAAEMAEGLAEEGDIDLDSLDPATLEAAAAAVLSGNEDGTEEQSDEGTEAAAETGDTEKTAAEKLAADYEHADKMGRIMAHAYYQELREIDKTAGAKEVAGKVGAHLKSNAKTYAAGAGGTAAGFAGGRMSKKEKKASAEGATESQTPAFDTLVQQRAAEILKENGIDPATGKALEPEKTASDDQMDVLAAKVNHDAHALLVSMGYQFEEETAAETK